MEGRAQEGIVFARLNAEGGGVYMLYVEAGFEVRSEECIQKGIWTGRLERRAYVVSLSRLVASSLMPSHALDFCPNTRQE